MANLLENNGIQGILYFSEGSLLLSQSCMLIHQFWQGALPAAFPARLAFPLRWPSGAGSPSRRPAPAGMCGNAYLSMVSN